MIELDLRLQKPMEDYVEMFAAQTPRSLSMFEPLLAAHCVFEDPYHTVHGTGAVCRLLARRLDLSAGGRYNVLDFMWGRRTGHAFMSWAFTFDGPAKTVAFGTQRARSRGFEGTSVLVFSGDGKLLSHTDFWGRHDEFNVRAYKALSA